MDGNTKFSRHLLAIACGVAVSLVGCGGSSSSSSNTGSTDGNNSESSNGTVTLTGKVVDEVIPFAEVCLYQGNTELECVTADANANYALTINRPTGDQPLRLVASKEVTGKGTIKLSSSLGLAKDIPADTEISQNTLPALAVTNISTALDVMALNANGLVDIDKLQQIRADENLSDAATALGTSIKDYVDSILDGSFTLEGRDTLEVAQLAKSVVEDGSLSAANLAALIELARSTSAKSAKPVNGSETRPATKGNEYKNSEAYELSTKPQLVSVQYIKATTPYELMSFDANGDLQWCKTDGCAVQPYEVEWNNTNKNWVIQAGATSVAVVDGIPDGYQMSRSLVKDQYDGWYFVELKGAEPSVSYQSHFFNTNGGYQFRSEALNKNYKQSDGWTWTAFKTLAELETETPSVQETWSVSGRTLVVGSDKYYRISDGEEGQWRFLKQSGNSLDLVRMLPMMSTSPNAPSFFAEIDQLASAGTGYSFLSFYEVEDYFGWANYYKANGKVNGCTTWLGDQESFAIYCVDEVSGDDRVRNLIKTDILDRDPAESFNYYFSGDLISSSFSFEEKVHCGDSDTCNMALEGDYHDPVKTARVSQPRIRTFDWSESVLTTLSGKTVAFQVLNAAAAGGVSTVEITFNSNISSAQSDLLASIKIDGTALAIQESILSSGVDVRNEKYQLVNPKPAQLARGFIHVNLNGLANVVGENINALQLFLHSQEVASDAKNIGISMVRVEMDAATKETAFYPLPSSVNISASVR